MNLVLSHYNGQKGMILWKMPLVFAFIVDFAYSQMISEGIDNHFAPPWALP